MRSTGCPFLVVTVMYRFCRSSSCWIRPRICCPVNQRRYHATTVAPPGCRWFYRVSPSSLGEPCTAAKDCDSLCAQSATIMYGQITIVGSDINKATTYPKAMTFKANCQGHNPQGQDQDLQSQGQGLTSLIMDIGKLIQKLCNVAVSQWWNAYTKTVTSGNKNNCKPSE